MNIFFEGKKHTPENHKFLDKPVAIYRINGVQYITIRNLTNCTGMVNSKKFFINFHERHKTELNGLVLEIEQTTNDKIVLYRLFSWKAIKYYTDRSTKPQAKVFGNWVDEKIKGIPKPESKQVANSSADGHSVSNNYELKHKDDAADQARLNTNLDYALEYARKGWSVLPLHFILKDEKCSCRKPNCGSPGKHPLSKLANNGVKNATTDEKVINDWWNQYPKANIGIATGKQSGIWVLDIDPRNGGQDTLDALEAQHGKLPDTVMVNTGGGGLHYYFQRNSDIPTLNGKAGKGIDVKAEGGYVVAPPSIHASGKQYQCELFPDIMGGVAVTNTPDWLMKLIEKTQPQVNRGKKPNEQVNIRNIKKNLRNALDHLADKGYSDDYNSWITVGLALKTLDNEKIGNQLFHYFSKKSKKYDHDKIEKKWKGFNPKKTSYKWILSEAKNQGWHHFKRVPGKPRKQNGGWKSRLDRTASGKIQATFNNLVSILSHDNTFNIRKDELRGCAVDHQDMPWCDAHSRELREWLGTKHQVTATSENLNQAILRVAELNAFHPVRDYLNNLEWDGISRIDSLFIKYLGVIDNAYTRAVARKWMCGAVKRVMQPGCKFDYVPILEGKGGIGKSEFARILSRDWFTDNLTDFNDKKPLEQLEGVWIAELPELQAFKKTDIEQIKAFITRRADKARKAYGRYVTEIPRQCVFIGTTNDAQYLMDETGNRRFWPILCQIKKVPFRKLEANIDKLWAEAASIYDKESLYLDNSLTAIAENEQQARMPDLPWLDTIKTYLDTPVPKDYFNDTSISDPDDTFMELDPEMVPRKYAKADDIWVNAMGGKPDQFSSAKARDIGKVMRRLDNWSDTTKTSRTGKRWGRCKVYVRDQKK